MPSLAKMVSKAISVSPTQISRSVSAVIGGSKERVMKNNESQSLGTYWTISCNPSLNSTVSRKAYPIPSQNESESEISCNIS